MLRPWPHLPKQLLNIVAKQSSLMKNISYDGVTKSWRLAPKHCNPVGKSPYPQLSYNSDGCHEPHGKSLPDNFDISFRAGYFWWFRGLPPSHYRCLHFVGYSHGVLVARGAYAPSQCYLWDTVKRGCPQLFLPLWDTNNVPFQYAALSSSPEDWENCVMMVLTGISHPAFAFYVLRKGNLGWSKQDCNLVDPHSLNQQQFMQFTIAIGFRGKFYALSLQGTLAVLEIDIESNLKIADLSTSRAVPSAPSKHFKEHLIESNGEILLVFLISRKSMNIVEDVEVHRLDFARLSWVKMERLGDRTMFVGTNCCMSVTASKVGCKSNCVYFTHQAMDGWWVYDMERGCISPGWNITYSSTKSPIWDEPIEEE
ncbi:uncharacterized protein LOC114288273 [Camellia sinensis]|uniref:KIB1-4 beta-propeller domain-containing protein n=1 Tax=Camellia sinensis var. sinensis TaxID=542762 RepID=A0A4S4DS96_CAMSN|nr:uncharacterized protein LOC114288273 [Camellia sinensis]THG06029.1 hypothetical protein TEA_014363 [Camellia sinensis var. sinensis]